MGRPYPVSGGSQAPKEPAAAAGGLFGGVGSITSALAGLPAAIDGAEKAAEKLGRASPAVRKGLVASAALGGLGLFARIVASIGSRYEEERTKRLEIRQRHRRPVRSPGKRVCYVDEAGKTRCEDDVRRCDPVRGRPGWRVCERADGSTFEVKD